MCLGDVIEVEVGVGIFRHVRSGTEEMFKFAKALRSWERAEGVRMFMSAKHIVHMVSVEWVRIKLKAWERRELVTIHRRTIRSLLRVLGLI